MATVTTPSGVVLEGVSGVALEYYQGLANVGEAYVIDGNPVAAAPSPVTEPAVEQAAPAEVAPVAEVADATPAPQPAEVLPEGQYRAMDGLVYDASGAPVNPQPEPPSA